MKKIIFTLICLATALTTFAGKADPQPQTVRQSDGTMITVVAHGDEYGNFVTTIDGALLVCEGGNFFVAQTTDKGELISTGVLAHEKSQRTAWEQGLVDLQDIDKFAQHFESAVTKRKKSEPVPANYFPHVGTPKALVVLVEFQDSTFYWDNTKEIFDSYLNGKTLNPELADGTLKDNYCSVAEYFNEMSFGQYRPQFDLVGPVKLPQKLKYYGSGSDNVSYLVRDAMPLIADSVDFKEYDLDGNGYIDLTYFICASYSQSQNSDLTDLMWPKVTTATYDTGQGVKTSRVGISCELLRKPTSFRTPHVSGIGLFCHEFSHTLGLPDLYSTTTPAQMLNQTYEYWDLMDGGEYTKNGLYPNAYSAWERECMGWMDIENLTDSQTVTLKPLSEEGGKAYRIYPEGEEGGKHYYIVENVQNKGCNSSVLGHGMLVYDITYDGHSMVPNNNYKKKNESGATIYLSNTAMTLVPADSFVHISYQVGQPIYNGTKKTTFDSSVYASSHYSDPYPGKNQVTEVLREVKDVYRNVMDNKYYYSTKVGYTGKPITNIKEEIVAGDDFATITFDFGNVVPALILGDANDDKTVDVADITAIAAYILGEEPEPFNLEAADANQDESIDVADITSTASIILGN
ncbi:MAG: M6 family metalloprotease domain-containing protein [Bacteroidaceae bacterium]|nr:M6 family metalloprotease domain-containing protein [Bacteroidaceae bacterium]